VDSAPDTAPESAEVAPALAAPTPEPSEAEAPAPKPRVRWKEDSEAGGDTPTEEEQTGEEEEEGPQLPEEAGRWGLAGSHFVLSFERLTTVLAWEQTSKLPVSTNGVSSGETVDITASGTDASLLFGGGERTPSSLPRIAFDGIFSGGFTFGGSLGLMSSAGKNKGNALRQETSLSDKGGALFGFRAGYFARTGVVNVWLRGGFTYFSATSEDEVSSSSGSPATSTAKATVSAWAFTLDPQLVVIAAPRIAITFGPLLDIPVSGTDKGEANGQTVELDYSSRAYGMTAGAAAIF
jgi:hypothetical protein